MQGTRSLTPKGHFLSSRLRFQHFYYDFRVYRFTQFLCCEKEEEQTLNIITDVDERTFFFQTGFVFWENTICK